MVNLSNETNHSSIGVFVDCKRKYEKERKDFFVNLIQTILPVVLIGLTGMYVVNVVASLNLFRGLRSHQSLMSKGTYKTHLAIFYMLLSQNIYPVFVMILPVILTGISFTINEHTLLASNVYKHYIYIGLIIYPAMSCIISTMIMKPYRTYVKRHIFGIKDLPRTLEPTLSISGARLTRSSLSPRVHPVMNHRSTNRSFSTM